MARKVLACALGALLAACAHQGSQFVVPDELKPPAGESLAVIARARGVQIYECRAARNGAGYEWVFVAPEAELFDANGNTIGRHGAGPQWQANDGSTIRGTLAARAEAPVAGAIPWLLLTTTSVGPPGTFSRVKSVQRVNTAGGLPPAAACSAPGTPARIDYSADYYFFNGS